MEIYTKTVENIQCLPILNLDLQCRIRFYFQTCRNKRVADEFLPDETRVRCTAFMPETLTFWYNMQCIWCTILTNINHMTRYKYIWYSLCICCWSLFVLFYFFFWPLCWLVFCNIRILIVPLVSYNLHDNNSAPMSTFSLLCLMSVETVCCFFILWSPVVSLCCWGVVVVVIVFGIYSYLCNQCASLQTLLVWIPLRRGVLEITLCDHVYQWFTTGQWSSPVTPVFPTNKTDLAEILLKVALSTITLSLTLSVLIDL